jgi:hypothetical protein
MSDNIIPFPQKKYGMDYHREEMERRGAGYVDHLLCNDQQAIAWLTTKGVLYTGYDEATGQWFHEWQDEAAS